jgi:hypothetical protein
MKRLAYRVLVLFLLVISLSITSFSGTTFAKDTSSYIVVFKDNQIPTEVKRFLRNNYPLLKTTLISEIGTIKLEKANNHTQNQAIK